MGKIEHFNHGPLRTNERLQYMIDAARLAQRYLMVEGIASPAYPDFVNAVQAEEQAEFAEHGSYQPEKTAELNTLRGKTYGAISKRIKATQESPFEGEVSSAKILRRIIDQLGNLRALTNSAETTELSRLVAELTAPANAHHLQVVGIADWVSELKKQNEEYQNLTTERAIKMANQNTVDIGKARKDSDAAYLALVEHINAAKVLNQASPAEDEFANVLNEKIKSYKTMLAHRVKRPKAAKE